MKTEPSPDGPNDRSGVINPTDLAMMKEVLKTWCTSQGIDPSGPRATHVAGELIENYKIGKLSQEELLQTLRDH